MRLATRCCSGVRMKRSTRQVLICGIIGVAINVGTAWALVLHQGPPFRPVRPVNPQREWDFYAAHDRTYGRIVVDSYKGAPGCAFLTLEEQDSDTGVPTGATMRITRAGAPILSLECMHSWGSVQPRSSWGLRIPGRPQNIAWAVILPCRPMLLGFLFNTIFYGSFAWLVLFGPGALRRRIVTFARLKRDCCPSCGYDLRASKDKCPECGAAIAGTKLESIRP